MYTINRALIVVKPKQIFADWVNAHPDSAGFTTTLDSLREDSTAYLIPEFDSDQEAQEYLEDLSTDIFEIELESWYSNESFWPKRRDYKTFLEWFDIEFHSMIIDPYENDIEKEEY